jgi:MFS family permease
MVQSSGSSGTVALANACVADLVTSAERGSYIAYTSLSSILAPALGPVIGGILAQYAGWHWIFGFLGIAAATFFIPFFLFFPETCRVIVGNGSIPPPRLNQSLPTYLLEMQKKREGDIAVFIRRDELAKNRKISFPNPMDTLRIVFSKTAGLILLSTSLLFSTAYAVMTSIPSQFSQRYGFDDLQVSLIYLPLAVGSTLSAFTTGKLIDRNYRRHAKKLGLTIDRNRQDDLSNFPIERSRIEVSMPIAIVGVVAVIGYGWMVDSNISLAGPCVMLFIFGYSMTAMFNTMNILMVDIYQGRPASATAANNLTRCLLGAGATAAVIPLTESIGIGWTCTLAAGLWGGFSLPLLLFLMKVGPRWRREAKARKDARAEKKAAAAKIKDEQAKVSDLMEKDISTEEILVKKDAITIGEKSPENKQA